MLGTPAGEVAALGRHRRDALVDRVLHRFDVLRMLEGILPGRPRGLLGMDCTAVVARRRRDVEEAVVEIRPTRVVEEPAVVPRRAAEAVDRDATRSGRAASSCCPHGGATRRGRRPGRPSGSGSPGCRPTRRRDRRRPPARSPRAPGRDGGHEARPANPASEPRPCPSRAAPSCGGRSRRRSGRRSGGRNGFAPCRIRLSIDFAWKACAVCRARTNSQCARICAPWSSTGDSPTASADECSKASRKRASPVSRKSAAPAQARASRSWDVDAGTRLGERARRRPQDPPATSPRGRTSPSCSKGRGSERCASAQPQAASAERR